MIRIPDRVFYLLQRMYLAQDRLRRTERRVALEAEDRRIRDHYADLIKRHDRGECGGVEAGCCYVPCVPPVGWEVS